MDLPLFVNIAALHCTGPKIVPIEIPVSAEYVFTLALNGRPFAPIVCSGSDLEALTLGHLAAEGVISSAKQVQSIKVDETAMSIDVRTIDGQEVQKLSSGTLRSSPLLEKAPASQPLNVPAVRASAVMASMNEFLQLSELHKLTHGVHSAALYSLEGERLCFFDEIGRHNAIDKAIGFAIRKGLAFDNLMLLSTGRLAGEIVQKALAVSAPVIVSRAAPTTRGIELARGAGMLMICGVRQSGFYIFSGEGFVEC